MKKSVGLLSVMLAGTMLGAPAASADETAQKDFHFMEEVEPNNAFDWANHLPLNDYAIGKLTDGDQDYYKVVINGDKALPVELFAGTYEDASSLDLKVTVYNNAQEELTPDYKDTAEGFYAGFEALSPGTYYFAVSDTSNKNNGEEYHFTASIATGEQEITRIEGDNRYETAVEIAKADFEKGEAPEVVLATGLDFPDALAGAPLAYQMDAPILLTKTNTIPDEVKEALSYFDVNHVTILGGESAIMENVENELKDMNIASSRISGENRYDTAAQIASKLDHDDTAYVTYGGDFPDALSVASIAAQEGSPILLTKTNELPAETEKALSGFDHTYAIGGQAVIDDDVLTKLPEGKRIAGDNRYETSVEVIKQLDVPVKFATVATGMNFADALAGSVYAADTSQPIVLTKKDKLSTPAAQLFLEKETKAYTILGGKNAVGEGVEDDLSILFD
ncbi:cell wall-binding repeat-containing protein [Bacillus sp. RAR_GA_16]|uniref:cell wall-binding repeat-containing protein n=1 Tax=Bacillus sp. RAR_GA_16 TaxID=2876774 RepID=UPI001CCF0640|nr:cell wall-binding repeat-containing protein [Bacillus sp. RAR_GA_16]MCA0170389.1 cell wall-binding repeat-containing protein [Bacillus sp. RAR_GA_16]